MGNSRSVKEFNPAERLINEGELTKLYGEALLESPFSEQTCKIILAYCVIDLPSLEGVYEIFWGTEIKLDLDEYNAPKKKTIYDATKEYDGSIDACVDAFKQNPDLIRYAKILRKSDKVWFHNPNNGLQFRPMLTPLQLGLFEPEFIPGRYEVVVPEVRSDNDVNRHYHYRYKFMIHKCGKRFVCHSKDETHIDCCSDMGSNNENFRLPLIIEDPANGELMPAVKLVRPLENEGNYPFMKLQIDGSGQWEFRKYEVYDDEGRCTWNLKRKGSIVVGKISDQEVELTFERSSFLSSARHQVVWRNGQKPTLMSMSSGQKLLHFFGLNDKEDKANEKVHVELKTSLKF